MGIGPLCLFGRKKWDQTMPDLECPKLALNKYLCLLPSKAPFYAPCVGELLTCMPNTHTHIQWTTITKEIKELISLLFQLECSFSLVGILQLVLWLISNLLFLIKLKCNFHESSLVKPSETHIGGNVRDHSNFLSAYYMLFFSYSKLIVYHLRDRKSLLSLIKTFERISSQMRLSFSW